MPADDRIFYTFVGILLSFVTLVVLYPLIHILSASFSSPDAVASGKVLLWPVEFSLAGYEAVFKDKYIIMGYLNTLYYTIVGTSVNVIMTLMIAYPLSRREVPLAGIVMFLFTFTMMFSGGMIPEYINIRNLGLLNTRWALILPGAIVPMNMIITRTFLRTNIPQELLDAAQIDGCNDYRFFFRIVLPLSKAVIAVITLYYAVGHWNAFFNAFMYLNRRELYPLQIILRDILIRNIADPNTYVDPETMEAMRGLSDLLKYSLIIVANLPILCFYPFIQRYFMKGVMLGSLKG